MSILEGCNLFQGVRQTTLEAVEAICEKQSYAAGTFVFQSGEPAQRLYILENGCIRLRFGDGGQVAYTLNHPAEVFGWSSIVNQAAYTLSAQTVSEASVVRLESKRLEHILVGDPSSGMMFYRHLAEFIGQRLSSSYKATVFVHGERSSLSYG
jgi:CRP/FNR family transcriptional regulator, cyclic AMP receptor protein